MVSKIRNVLIGGMVVSTGLLLAPSTIAACVSSATGTNISCSGDITTPQSFNSPTGLNVTVEKGVTALFSTDNRPVFDFVVRSGTLTNNGVITTTGQQNDGIMARSSDFQTISNNGLVFTSGNASSAIRLSELTKSQVSNNADLVTSGENSHGINVSGGSWENTITNTASIIVSGANSDGISATNSRTNKLVNQGTITASGAGGSGIQIGRYSSGYTIDNQSNGVIYAENGYGVLLSDESSGTTLSNSGTIDGHLAGVALSGNASASSIINTGIIIGGEAGAGLLFEDNSNTNLLLNRGIIGSIDGDAIRAENNINITNGINNEGIIIGRVNAPASNMSNSGIFELLRASPASTVNNYNQTSSGVLALEADSANSYGQLQVAGNASLNGTTLVITNGSTRFNDGDKLSDVVSAANITGTPSAVRDDSLRYQFIQEQTANSYSLRVAETKLTTVKNAVTTVSTNNALAGVGTTLDTIINNNVSNNAGGMGITNQVNNCSGALASTVCAITSSFNADQVHRSVVQLAPLMDGSMPYIALNNLRAFGDIVDQRQASVRGQAYYNEFTPEKYLWLKPFGRWDNQASKSDYTGYNADTRGIAIGADGRIVEHARVGLALGMSRTDVGDTSSEIRHDAQVESWNMLAYGSFDFTANTGMSWQAGYGRNSTTGNRYMNIVNPADGSTAFSGVAHSDYDSHTLQAGLGLYSAFYPTKDLSLTPELRTDYYRVKDKGYQENGAEDVGLKVNGTTTEALIVSSKLKAGLQLSEVVNVHGYVGAGYDTKNERSDTTATFIGSPDTPFTYRGMSESPWIAMAGVGVTAKFTDVLDGSVEYDAAQRTKFTSQSVSLKLRYAF